MKYTAGLRSMVPAFVSRHLQRNWSKMDRSHSLKKNKEFQYVYRAGKSCSNNCVVLIYAKSRHKGVRVGFSVSKKIGNAIVRNRVKRRVRESFRVLLPRVKTGYSLVFVARNDAVDADFNSLRRGIERLIGKSGLLIDD